MRAIVERLTEAQSRIEEAVLFESDPVAKARFQQLAMEVDALIQRYLPRSAAPTEPRNPR